MQKSWLNLDCVEIRLVLLCEILGSTGISKQESEGEWLSKKQIQKKSVNSQVYYNMTSNYILNKLHKLNFIPVSVIAMNSEDFVLIVYSLNIQFWLLANQNKFQLSVNSFMWI